MSTKACVRVKQNVQDVLAQRVLCGGLQLKRRLIKVRGRVGV